MKPLTADLKGLRILIIEDQSCVTYLLSDIEKKLGNKINDFSQEGDVHVANSYSEAEKLAQSPTFDYHIVFLDNRLITERHTDEKPEEFIPKELQGRGYDIKDEFSSAQDYKYGNGYKLIRLFEEKGAIVVGSSSMSENELRQLGIAKAPELRCSKMDIPDDVLKQIMNKLEKFRENNEGLETQEKQINFR